MKLPGLKEFLSQYDSTETRRAYSRDIKRFFSECGKKPDKITKLEAIEFINDLKDSEFSSASINRMVSSVRSYMRFLIDIDIITKNPFRGVKLPRIYHKEKESLSDEEIRSIFKSISESKNGFIYDAVVCLMLYNGLRRSEICNLNLGDIRKTEHGRTIVIRGKGDKIRERPLHPDGYVAVIAYLKSEDRLVGGKADHPIFLNKFRKRMNPQSVNHVIEKVTKMAGIKRSIHPHLFRSKFASIALESGQPITSVQADMGHSSVETTASYDQAKKNFERSAILGIKSFKEPSEKEGKDD